MMTATALYTLLSADAGLTALVGTRIYPSQAPQSVAAPYIVWFRVSSIPFTTHNEATGNQYDRVQFSIFAASFSAADAIATALLAALDNVTLSTGDTASFENRRDGGFEPGVNLHRIDLDFLV